MKKLIIASLSLALGAGAANAQVVSGELGLIAGWEFTNITPVGASISLEKSDTEPDGGLSGAEGAFFFDGSFGSTDIFNAGGQGLVYNGYQDQGLASAANILTRPSAQDFQAGGSLDDGFGIRNFDILPVENFVISITPDTFAPGAPAFEDWSFSYAAAVTDGDGLTIDWAWSVDGTNWNAIGQESIGTSDAAYGLSGFGTASSTMYLQANLLDFDAGPLATGGGEFIVLDNFAVYGVAVPEPSTYAAIVGGLVLGLIGLRRRRRS